MQRVAASFRDPAGFVFIRDGILYRQVNQVAAKAYNRLMTSGLYDVLVQAAQLIEHDEVENPPADRARAYKVIRPTRVPFVAYPYEWCFSQLKESALLTLEIQRQAIAHQMSLKDASAYNIQLYQGHPILIDTLSFEEYREGEPWVAYRQFCQHFLAPLALMAYRNPRLNQLFRIHIDGIPLDLAASLLPWRSRLKPALLTHLHLHAAVQRRYAHKDIQRNDVKQKLTQERLLGIIGTLEAAIRGLHWFPEQTEWSSYYENLESYTKGALEQKRKLVEHFIEICRPRTVWDLGANTGYFSRLACARGALTISTDLDPGAVDLNYRAMRENRESHLVPLVLDMTNPSPAIGWHNTEHMSFVQRGPADMLVSLALIHHLAIGHNVSLQKIASLFRDLSSTAVIEFVPKSDPQVRRLLSMRKDIFSDYTEENFLATFNNYFTVEQAVNIVGSDRTLYLMIAKD